MFIFSSLLTRNADQHPVPFVFTNSHDIRYLQVFSLDIICQSCSISVHTINSVVYATAMVGGASAVACIAIAATIVAHGRDRDSMRDRIVVGLMLANAVYSTANAIPLNALRTAVSSTVGVSPCHLTRFG